MVQNYNEFYKKEYIKKRNINIKSLFIGIGVNS